MEKASKKPTGTKKQPAAYTQEQNNSMLQELFIEHLRDMYWAEKHLVKALPKMEKAATSEELASAFADHLAVTQEQVTRLEEVFELMGEKARGKKCDAMEGLVKEAESVIEETEEGTSTRDVALIIAAQKVEHYEIATYGGLATLAKTLGKNEVKELLGQTLEEEKETDELLTQLAENNINQSASQEME
jgi:ferritin-like metal-binding protein YciE